MSSCISLDILGVLGLCLLTASPRSAGGTDQAQELRPFGIHNDLTLEARVIRTGCGCGGTPLASIKSGRVGPWISSWSVAAEFPPVCTVDDTVVMRAAGAHDHDLRSLIRSR